VLALPKQISGYKMTSKHTALSIDLDYQAPALHTLILPTPEAVHGSGNQTSVEEDSSLLLIPVIFVIGSCPVLPNLVVGYCTGKLSTAIFICLPCGAQSTSGTRYDYMYHKNSCNTDVHQ